MARSKARAIVRPDGWSVLPRWARVADIAAFTVAGIAARELLGDTSLAGASATTIVLGSALGTSVLAWTMVRSTRRPRVAMAVAALVVGQVVMIGIMTMALVAGGVGAILRLRRQLSPQLAPS